MTDGETVVSEMSSERHAPDRNATGNQLDSVRVPVLSAVRQRISKETQRMAERGDAVGVQNNQGIAADPSTFPSIYGAGGADFSVPDDTKPVDVDEKKRQIVDSFEIPAAIKAMHDAIDNIAGLAKLRIEAQLIIRSRKDKIETIKADVLLNGGIDGKNAEQRSAQLLLALNSDPRYQEASEAINSWQYTLDVVDADLEHERMAYSTAKAALNCKAAALTVLGS